MQIIPDDYTFAKSGSEGISVPFGTGGDCFSAKRDSTCRKGTIIMQFLFLKNFFQSL